MILKRPQQAQFQDALLTMAGYRVIRYEDVPEYYQLRGDFLREQEHSSKDQRFIAVNDLKNIISIQIWNDVKSKH